VKERTIFLHALERDSTAERMASLAEVCGGDAAPREPVEQLLQLHQGAGSFLAMKPRQEAKRELLNGFRDN
jgi:hypothetical protein